MPQTFPFKLKQHVGFALLFFASFCSHAVTQNEAALSVWVNEAIVSTYTFNYKNHLEAQKKTAHYYTAKGWSNYISALMASKLLDVVKEKQFSVSAVALSPPEIETLPQGHWKAQMPVLVVYKNSSTEQKQTLNVSLVFKATSDATGVRGLAIESFQSKPIKPACHCDR